MPQATEPLCNRQQETPKPPRTQVSSAVSQLTPGHSLQASVPLRGMCLAGADCPGETTCPPIYPVLSGQLQRVHQGGPLLWEGLWLCQTACVREIMTGKAESHRCGEFRAACQPQNPCQEELLLLGLGVVAQGLTALNCYSNREPRFSSQSRQISTQLPATPVSCLFLVSMGTARIQAKHTQTHTQVVLLLPLI